MTRPVQSLIPSIEHRIAGWTAIHDRLKLSPGLKVRPTVTISRELGCEGFTVAESVRQRLEKVSGEPWLVYDRSLVEKVAAMEGVPASVLENLGERSRALEGLGIIPPNWPTADEAFSSIARYMVQVAQVGNAVIVGRGGSIICHGMPNCFHFRLVASPGWRVQRLARRLETTEAQAESLAKAHAAEKDEFVLAKLHANAADPALYDAVFNVERHAPECVGASIAEYVHETWKERGWN